MAGSVNKVILIGNLGRDPEIRTTNGGKVVASLSIATSESWRDKQSGERRERTEWHRVVIFNEGLAKIAEKYVAKGSKVYIEGTLRTRKWVDSNQQERYTTEIVLEAYSGVLTMLDGAPQRDGDASDDGYGGGQGSGGRSERTGGATVPAGDLDDEIPF